jgi:hypothetical protein
MIRRVGVWVILAVWCAAPRSRAQMPERGDLGPDWDAVYLAWDAGRYDAALERLERLLEGPGAERYLEAAALLTGELFVTTQLSRDGRGVRWSADGEVVAFEAPPGAPRVITLAAVVGPGDPVLTSLPGLAPSFSSRGRRVAYLALEDLPELQMARAELARAVATRAPGAARLRQDLSLLELRRARLTVHDPATGAATEIPLPGLMCYGVGAGWDDGSLVVVAGPPDTVSRRDLYLVGPGLTPERLTDGPEAEGAPVVARGGRHLIYTLDQSRFAVRDLATGETRVIAGTPGSLSADGSTLVWVAREGTEYVLRALSLAGDSAARVLKRSSRPLANPSVSADGRRVVHQQMPREDWELFVVGSDGAGERRLTREIQHDVLPRWLGAGRILAAMGEPRHRRSYLYDPETGERTRLFHNNTVRTVAPEYEWAVSRDGTRVAIVADRDGDTVSPERGVYLVDLTRRVSLAEVRARVSRALAAERDLRSRGARMYAPVAPAVRAAVADVSVARVYGYARDLFRFDSKHITRAGNRLAVEYLERTLRSFGYQPELQWFEPRPGVHSANVIATLRGTVNPELVYVVSSHFDSVEDGPGSDDNSSGTTALLEAARVLARRPQPATIQFAFFTGEEAGLLGSREFVRRAVADRVRLVGALNNDMIGWTNDHRLDNTIRYSNDGIRDLQHAAAFLFTDLITYDSRYYQNTDAAAYYEVYGDIVGGIGSYPILGNPHYHQSHDVLETINQRLVAEVSKTTVASLMLLASSPSRIRDLTVGQTLDQVTTAAWEPAAERGVRRYQVQYGPPENPGERRLVVTGSRVVLPGARLGWEVRVRAVNAGGLPSWDWARAPVTPTGPE